MSWWSELREIVDALLESDSVIYSVWPVTADEQSGGKAIASGGAADDWGAWIPVIAAADIATLFWYVGTQLLDTGQVGEDAAVQIGYTDGTGPPPTLIRAIDEIEWRLMTAVDTQLGMPLVMVPYPVRIPASGEVSARSATVNAGTKDVVICIKVATGL